MYDNRGSGRHLLYCMYTHCRYCCRAMLELIHIYCEMEDHSVAIKHIMDCLQITSDNHLTYQHALCQLYAAHVQVPFPYHYQCMSALRNTPADIFCDISKTSESQNLDIIFRFSAVVEHRAATRHLEFNIEQRVRKLRIVSVNFALNSLSACQ